MIDPVEELSRVPQSTKIRALVCAMIVNIITGSYYFYSNINAYVAAYLKSYDPEVSSRDTLVILPISLVCQTIGTLMSVGLCQRYGYPAVSNASYAMFAFANLVMVFTKSYWLFLFFYGIVGGLAIGCGYLPPLYIAWTYYPDHKAVVTTLCLFVSGMASAFLSPLSSYIVDPKNSLSPWDMEGRALRVPVLFLILFLIYASIAAAVIILQPVPFQHSLIADLAALRLMKRINRTVIEKRGTIFKTESKPSFNEKFKFENHKEIEQEIITPPADRRLLRNSSIISDKSSKRSLLLRTGSGIPNSGDPFNDADHWAHSALKKVASYHDILAPDQPMVSQTEFDYLISREIKRESEGFATQQESYMIGLLNSEQLAGLVATSKSVQELVGDRQDVLRNQIKSTMNSESLQISAMIINKVVADTRRDSIQLDTIEDMQKKALGLITPKEVTNWKDDKQSDDLMHESIRLSLQKMSLACPSVKVALCSSQFICLFIMAFCCSCFNYFMNSVWKEYYTTKIACLDKQMSLMVSYGAFANSFVRVLSSMLLVLYDFKQVYLGLIVFTSFLCLTIDAFLVNYIAGAVYSVGFFSTLAVQFTIFPTVCSKVFGPAIGPRVFICLFSSFCLASIVQYIIFSTIDDFSTMFRLLGVVSCVGACAGLVFDENPDWSGHYANIIAARELEKMENPGLFDKSD